jgi:glycerophosphoryl diester phosphodiesterase
MKSVSKIALSVIGAIGVTTGSLSVTYAATSRSSLLDPNHFDVIAHRGASAYAPEETMPAFELAKKMGATYLEMDVQLTKDGVPVLMHDTTVNRTTNGKGALSSYTLSQLEKLDAGSWFNKKYPKYAKSSYIGVKVPTLDEVLKYFGKSVNYYIETKNAPLYPGIESKVIAELRKYHLVGPGSTRGQVIIESFYSESLKKIHQMDPQIPLIQLLDYHSHAKVTSAQIAAWKKYAVGVGPNYNMIDENYVKQLRKNGLLVHPWTVDSTTEMRTLMSWGATGMFTGHPDQLLKLVNEAKTKTSKTTSATTLPELYYGSRGSAVKTLQSKLNALHYHCGKVDGIFGNLTLQAVKKFQKAEHLLVDGIVGKQTWSKLGF